MSKQWGPPHGAVLALPVGREGYEAIWRDLFYQYRQDDPIEIIAHGSDENQWSLKIFYDPAEPAITPFEAAPNASSGTDAKMDFSSIAPIKFVHTRADASHVFKPIISASKIAFEGGGDQGKILAAYYSSSFASASTPSESASQFSDLDKKNKARPILNTIKRLYPRIKSLSVQTDGGMPVLYCETKGMKEKTPLGLESSASHKLTSILLGMANHANGIVLIDEIENGFYYKKLKDVWCAILTFADQFNVQVFASTHSIECLRSLAVAMRGREHDLRLLRAELKEGKHIVRGFTGDQFEAAIETETEVR